MEREIISSLRYDDVSCEELADLRDREAEAFGLPADAEVDHSASNRFRYRFTGLGTVVPDVRSSKEREVGLARGRIDAMNRSMARRGC